MSGSRYHVITRVLLLIYGAAVLLFLISWSSGGAVFTQQSTQKLAESHIPPALAAAHGPQSDQRSTLPKTLVIYVYAVLLILFNDCYCSRTSLVLESAFFRYIEKLDYAQRLEFFIEFGVNSESDGAANVDYLFIIQGHVCSAKLPTHLPNVMVISRNNTCYDYGGVGRAIEYIHEHVRASLLILCSDGLMRTHFQYFSQPTRRQAFHNELAIWDRYAHFIVLNPSAIGPILPRYWPSEIHWSRIFTDKLNAQVKLVGSALVCLPPKNRGGYGPKVHPIRRERILTVFSREPMRSVRWI